MSSGDVVERYGLDAELAKKVRLVPQKFGLRMRFHFAAFAPTALAKTVCSIAGVAHCVR